jgi:hypothetical protein
VRSARSRSRTRRSIMLSALGVLVGLGLVLVGLVASLIVLSVVGFVIVVASCGWAVQSLRRHPTGPSEAAPQSGRSPRQTGLRTRMEDRLRRRFDES